VSVHPAAAQGFEAGADAYERGRPTYPDDAVAYLIQTLGIGPGSVVVDLAAGTGKFTRLLVPTGAELIAVEPVAGMRERLEEILPGVRTLDATAESMPLAGASVDAVIAAQAFHWFDAPRAVAEIARVLKPGGGLGMIWNVRDERVPWVAEVTAITEPHRAGTPTHRTRHWVPAFAASEAFTPLVERTFSYEQHLAPERAVDRVLSVSFIAALPEAERDVVANQVRAVLASDEATKGREEIALPHRTDVFTCARR
jgi:ubiquinone/menaquinone biosynthesis C-methylase UbiE